MSSAIINDLVAAKRSRERDKTESNQFYDQQAHICAQWQLGEEPPDNLILGELPYIGMNQIRLDRDYDLVVN